MCDGVADCKDAGDENICVRFDKVIFRKESQLPPALLIFDGAGDSKLLPMTRALRLNGTLANGTLMTGSLVDVELTAETLVNGTLGERTLVSGSVIGILAKGTLISGMLVNEVLSNGTLVSQSLNAGIAVSGILVSGALVNATLIKGSLVAGTLVEAIVSSGSAVCPDTHFLCAAGSYCVPVFTRCNDIFDCPGHEDEAGCDSYQCPGFYRCLGAKVCVHRRHVCDGVLHCLHSDDEILCDITCPYGCTCYGLSLFCSRVITAALYPWLRYFDASNSGMSVDGLQNNTMLVHLSLVRCDVTDWGHVSLPNLRRLDLTDNNVTKISRQLLHHLPKLKHLTLANNPLTRDFLSGMTLQESFERVHYLDVSGVSLLELDASQFKVFPGLHTLNLTGCGLDRLLGNGFQSLKQLRVLDLRGCPMTFFPKDVFHGLGRLTAVYGDNYKLCCHASLPAGFYLVNCKAPSDEVSSCGALLRSVFFRICLSLFAVLSCFGNLSSLIFRFMAGRNMQRTGFDLLIANLCVSDFLMGVYLAIIGVADRLYLGTYLWSELTWRHSAICKLAGFLSFLSNEVSAFVICLITLDRFLALRFPFSRLRFNTTTASLASFCTWTTCLAIATVPLLPMTSSWHFYSQTGICIPLPTSRKNFEGQGYAFAVMIVLNFVLFVMVALGQLLVYVSVQKHKLPTIGDTVSAFKKDQTLARRLITVAVSDFLCWFPVGMVGIMAANGYQIPGEINVSIAIFALPLNSSINPFLYTLNIVLEKRRRAREQRIKQFFLSHMKSRSASIGCVAPACSKCMHEESAR